MHASRGLSQLVEAVKNAMIATLAGFTEDNHGPATTQVSPRIVVITGVCVNIHYDDRSVLVLEPLNFINGQCRLSGHIEHYNVG